MLQLRRCLPIYFIMGAVALIAEHPDYVYRTAGYFGDAIPYYGERQGQQDDPFGAPAELAQNRYEYNFRQNEIGVMLDLFEQLHELEQSGVISGKSTVHFDHIGRAWIHSTGLGEILDPLCDLQQSYQQDKTLKSEVLEQATPAQRLLYLQSLYERWGVRGYNVIHSRHISNSSLISLLKPHTIEIYTIQEELSTPRLRLTTFIPQDTTLAEQLGIQHLLQVQLGPTHGIDLPSDPQAEKEQLLNDLQRMASQPDLDRRTRHSLRRFLNNVGAPDPFSEE